MLTTRVLALLLCVAASPAFAEPPVPEADRIKWFHEAKLGVFIHWGAYSVIGRHEWARQYFRIPQAEYDKYAPVL